jgi:hypothetical protein
MHGIGLSAMGRQSICNLVKDDKNVKDMMVIRNTTRSGAKEDIFSFANFTSFPHLVIMVWLFVVCPFPMYRAAYRMRPSSLSNIQ